MNALWDAYWPILVAASVIGVITGAIAFRATPARRPKTGAFRRRAGLTALGAGLLVLALMALWHGPVGTGERFVAAMEQDARQVLVNYEMTQDRAAIERHPLRRTIVLSGPADDFQRTELARIVNLVPGVASVRWADMPQGSTLPLLVETELASLAFFGLGLLLSYLLELRRRYRTQWRW